MEQGILKYLTQIGIGGIFALLVIDRVFTFMKNRNGGRPLTRNDVNGSLFKCGFDQNRDEIRDLLREIARNTRRND